MGNQPRTRHIVSAILLSAFFAMPIYAIAQADKPTTVKFAWNPTTTL